MARVIWVEILSRNGQVAARYRCTGPELRIGRSYRSDVIIDDPAVAPDHLRVTQSDDGAIVVEAVSGAGFSIHGERRERSLIDGDTVLRLGHTALRIRDEAYAVPAASPASREKPRWVMLSALVLATLSLDGIMVWLDETTQPRFSRDVAGVLALAGVLLLWTALWALLSRIFAGATRFPRHLGIAVGVFLAYTIYSILAEAAAFSLSSGAVADNLAKGIWVALGVACFLHLQTIAPGRGVLKAGIVGLLAIAGIAIQVTGHLEQLKNGQPPSIARTTFPPAFRLAHPKSEDQFFAAVDALQVELDADRETGATAP